MTGKPLCGPAFPSSESGALHKIGMAAIFLLPENATPEEKDRAYVTASAQAAQGMSLRDYFAGQAIQGLLNRKFTVDDADRPFVTWATELSYEVADAMLAERAK